MTNDERIQKNEVVFFDYYGLREGEKTLTIYELKDFIKDHPNVVFYYQYGIISMLDGFKINDDHLWANDAHGYAVNFDLEVEDYEFFIENFFFKEE